MILGARQTLLNNSQNNIKPIMWFDAINNVGKNQHATLNSSTPWKSLVNSDIYDAVTNGGNPTWTNTGVSFSSPNQVYRIRQHGNVNGYWQNICNRRFSIHIVTTLTSFQYWNGVCGGGQDTEELLGFCVRCSSNVVNIGELYQVIQTSSGNNITYDCPTSLLSLNTPHCIDVIADINSYTVYIDGVLRHNVALDLNTPWVFGNQLVFKMGSSWSATMDIASDQVLKGKFHELQVFNTVITETYITQLVETSLQRYS